MEIRKLFGQDAVTNTNAQKSRADVDQTQADAANANAAQAASNGEDQVSVSKLSRQLLQVSDIVADDSKARADKVSELKRRVADGTYNVDSSDVARSLVSYASDQPPLREI